MANATPVPSPMPTAAPAPATRPQPRLGEMVQVRAKPGVRLINNETGGFFATDVPTPQTVSVTLLRRLADGDMELL
jgi:hypothetical protein